MNGLRIGTRGSKLALRQASLVRDAIRQADGTAETEIVVVHTRGDRLQDTPLSKIGDKGVFASELEQALLSGQIDLAVHSAKDLPMKLAARLMVAAVLPRADVRDVLVVKKGGGTPLLRQGADGIWELANGEETEGKSRAEAGARAYRIGTGSRRRRTLAEAVWENVVCEEIRGNVDTRLRKLREGRYDGVLLAKAGLDRLGTVFDGEGDLAFYPLSPERFMPAACQGIIAVEAVEGSAAAQLCRGITDAETQLCYLAEREALAQLSADCSEAAGAWCRVKHGRGADAVLAACGANQGDHPASACEDRLLLDVMYAGRRVSVTGPVSAEDSVRLAREAAQSLRRQYL